MKTIALYLIKKPRMFGCFLFLASSLALAQKDTVEFKFIPKYYPEDNTQFITLPPPHVVHSPKILYPKDSKLQGREAKVWVKVLVDRKGLVGDAQVFKTSDEAFNKYAIKYAKQYKFKWSDGWPTELKNQQHVWISLPINFKQ